MCLYPWHTSLWLTFGMRCSGDVRLSELRISSTCLKRWAGSEQRPGLTPPHLLDGMAPTLAARALYRSVEHGPPYENYRVRHMLQEEQLIKRRKLSRAEGGQTP